MSTCRSSGSLLRKVPSALFPELRIEMFRASCSLKCLNLDMAHSFPLRFKQSSVE